MDALPELTTKEFITHKWNIFKRKYPLADFLCYSYGVPLIILLGLLYLAVQDPSQPIPESVTQPNNIVYMGDDGVMYNISPTELIQQQAKTIHSMKQREESVRNSEQQIAAERIQLVKTFEDQKRSMATEYNQQVQSMAQQIVVLKQQLETIQRTSRQQETNSVLDMSKAVANEKAQCDRRVQDITQQFRTTLDYQNKNFINTK